MPRWIRPMKRRKIMWRDGLECVYCGAGLAEVWASLDHVVPRSKGGGNGEDNLVSACQTCNRMKGDRLLSEAAQDLAVSRNERNPGHRLFTAADLELLVSIQLQVRLLPLSTSQIEVADDIRAHADQRFRDLRATVIHNGY